MIDFVKTAFPVSVEAAPISSRVSRLGGYGCLGTTPIAASYAMGDRRSLMTTKLTDASTDAWGR